MGGQGGLVYPGPRLSRGPGLGNCEKCTLKDTCKTSNECSKCKDGWDGTCCTRRIRNIPLRKGTPSRCLPINESWKSIPFKNGTENFQHIELFFPEGEQFYLSGCNVTFGENKCNVSVPSGPVTGSIVLSCHHDVKAAKIKIACATENSIKLCNVKVYWCKDFWWGPENGCQPCRCANGQKCDKWTGDCNDGGRCAHGWYGQNCSIKCPSCFENETCNESSVCPTTASGGEKTTTTAMVRTSTGVVQVTSSDVRHSTPKVTVTQEPPTTSQTRTTPGPSVSRGPPTTPGPETLGPFLMSSTERWNTPGTTDRHPKLLDTSTVAGVNHQSVFPTNIQSFPMRTIVISVIVIVSVAVIVAGAAVFLNRRRLKKTCGAMMSRRSSDSSMSLSLPDSGVNRGDSLHIGLSGTGIADQTSSLTPGGGQEDAVYANTIQLFAPTTTPISCQNFRNHTSHLLKNNGFTREYEALPGDFCDSVNDAILPQNISRNRFKGLYPYDNNRVVLRPIERDDTDYINASYIDGYKESMAYIATQGPLPGTIPDFWHMVWSEDCGKIVMLTNLVEPPKVKCAKYWPDEAQSEAYGHYSITCLKVNTYSHYVHRVLSLSRSGDQENQEARKIHHFQFTAWPDHDVPNPTALVIFHTLVRHSPTLHEGPLLVHCSAGVGRSGTYIALDILTREAEATSCVSVFPTVRHIRRQRMKMVQNLAQYWFLHEALAEALESMDSVIMAHDVLHGSVWKSDDKTSQLPDGVRKKLLAQFQALDSQRPQPSMEQTKTARQQENVWKNRFPDILPVEEYRVCLWTPDESASDYINAVFLPSHYDHMGFIATQLPLADTVLDFWRMTFDWKVATIVQLIDGPPDQHSDGLFPVPGSHISLGPFTVCSKDASPWLHGIHRQTLMVQNKEVGDIWQSVQVYLVSSPDILNMKNTAPWLSLTKVLAQVPSQGTPPPVLIQCFDGASKSCFLIALAITLRSIDENGQASPYLIAHLLQNARPQAFMHFEEYEFLICCMVDHLRKTNKSLPDDQEVIDQSIRWQNENTYGNI
ncbi:receptor-type tyrosine-protein phosphatase alpha-like isoform X2 [Pomacea canaliculata]|uniref:receptor-type tyrosine-protein phosphatase alpha-like isoform X2 n=1 Tax=Pomacea canaliculata TaxID=400727 RepID=UPI000D731A09|nr:receptor-type tyrosine-protein phosphatase alpha-like isoform X2 [Pomacea canaliculata]